MNLHQYSYDNSPLKVRTTSNEIGYGGCFIVLRWTDGDVTVTYNGSTHLDFNVFTAYPSDNHHDSLIRQVEEKLTSGSNTIVTDGGDADIIKQTYEHFPRGYGRVINSRRNINTHKNNLPFWVTRDD